jgi:hypothetical protein
MIAYDCYICTEPVPFTLEVSHHKIPRAYGGKDGENEVDICTRCHDVLHRVALMLRNPTKSGLVRDTLKTVYNDNKAIATVIDLAQTINKYALAKKEFQLDNQIEIEEVVQFSLPAVYKAKLRLLANETVDGKGRRLGVQRFVRLLIIDLVDKRFGGCQNEYKSRTKHICETNQQANDRKTKR